ncbi:PhzF family phenazine biosynthesis protein [Mycobacterium sp. pUA109]|uniref:PhzF family phenazine biosynthesis protein n=1 Tax=Mycobacterium sp. pUA109 TaxID=3238982 RepID=UPI00351B4FE4
MTMDVTVLRVFTDVDRKFGNALGVVESSSATAQSRQRLAAQLGFSETIFIDPPKPGSFTARAHIFTPAVELPFAGHPAVGAAWWLRARGMPVHALDLPAGIVEVDYVGELSVVSVFVEWTPEFVIHDLDTPQDVLEANPDEYFDDFPHYLWAWVNKSEGHIRSRSFAPELGVDEDEATGAAAVRITEYLGRDLTVTQGKGSVIRTWWRPDGWIQIGGHVRREGLTRVT